MSFLFSFLTETSNFLPIIFCEDNAVLSDEGFLEQKVYDIFFIDLLLRQMIKSVPHGVEHDCTWLIAHMMERDDALVYF